MGLHIFATDNVLAEHFPVRLTADGGSCSPEGRSPVGSSRRRSAHRNSADQHVDRVLGGAILLNVFIDELSPERHSGFGWVVAGLVACASADLRTGRR
jgi:hypothetical protein